MRYVFPYCLTCRPFSDGNELVLDTDSAKAEPVKSVKRSMNAACLYLKRCCLIAAFAVLKEEALWMPAP